MFTILTPQKYKRIFILSTFSCYLFAFKFYVLLVSYLKPLICFDLLQIRFKDSMAKLLLFGIAKGISRLWGKFFHRFFFSMPCLIFEKSFHFSDCSFLIFRLWKHSFQP